MNLGLGRYVLADRPALARSAIWGLAALAPYALIGWLVASAADAALHGATRSLIFWLALLALTSLAGAAAGWAQMRSAARLTQSVQVRLGEDVARGGLARATQDWLAPGTGGVELGQFVRQIAASVGEATRAAPRLLAGFAAAIGGWLLSPQIGLLLTVSACVSAGLFAVYLKLIMPRFRTQLETSLAVGHDTDAVIRGVRDIIAYSALERAELDLNDRFRSAYRARLSYTYAQALGQAPLSIIVQGLPLLAYLLLIPAMVKDQSITTGGALGGVTYILSGFTVGLSAFLSVATQILTAGASLRRIRQLTADPRAAGADSGAPATTVVDVSQLAFSYSPHARPMFHNLDLRLEPGDHLAVVGPSGIGKSTLAALIAGLLPPTQGTVQIAGRPASKLSDTARRQHVAMVPQEPYVFPDTLRANLRELAPAATDEQILAAGARVGLDRVLDRLGGLDSYLDPLTAGLSQGERQLIVLTRVHLSPATLIILDEATCFLDPAAESHAEQAFLERPDTALIVIAHRMSSSLRAKRVLVIDADNTVLDTHDKLIQTNPLYQNLHGLWAAGTSPRT